MNAVLRSKRTIFHHMKTFLHFRNLLNLTLVSTTLIAAAQAPNLIVIMTDDQGYGDVGFNGCTDIPTPSLDRLGGGGVVFTDGYVTYPVCGPSRAGFMTGRYPQTFGFERNPAWRPWDPECGLPTSETTIGEALQSVGYTTAIIGKWHLGSHDTLHPLEQGFDEFYGHLGGGHRYFPEELTIRTTTAAQNEPDSYRTWILRDHEPECTEKYLTEEFTEEALDFVRRHHEDPFFLFLSYNAPHGPLQAPEDEIARFSHLSDPKRRIYAAMVSIVDRGVGELLDLLDDLELTENTLVIFLSDNGGPENANGSDNGPLRGGKSDPFEGGIRVPMAARWPGRIAPGTTFSQPVSSLDIYATIAALNRLPENSERPLDGVNWMPYLDGERMDPPHEYIYLRKFDQGIFAVRGHDYKVIMPAAAARPRLFNLQNDLSESNNIANGHVDRVNYLTDVFQLWNERLVEPIFTGLSPDAWK